MATYTTNKTRTWKGRHKKAILRLENAIQLCKIKNPFVIQIGPGAIAERFAHLYPEGDEEDRTFMERKMHQAIAMIESRERDNPASSLVTYETQEVYDMLQRNGGFSRFLVVDNNQRVLNTVKNLGLKGIETLNWDIEERLLVEGSNYLKADIVIAWKVLEYCDRNYSAALSTVLKVPKERGIAAFTIPEGHERDFRGYAQTAHGIYVSKPNIFHAKPLDYTSIERIAVSNSPGR